MVNKGVNQMGKSTELSFLAKQEDVEKRCYCRAKNSVSVAGEYDEKSSDSYIKITGLYTLYCYTVCNISKSTNIEATTYLCQVSVFNNI